MTKLKSLVAAASLAALGIGTANAAPVLDVMFAGFQQLSDNSAEYLVNGQASTGETTLDVGDRLVGILDINSVEQAPFTRNLGGDSGNAELSAIFDITVVAKTSLGAAGWSYIFAPSAGFQATYGAGAVVALFEDSTPDYTRITTATATTTADMEALASNGDHVVTVALNGPETFWVAQTVTDDIVTIGNLPAPGNGGTYNLGANFTFLAPGWEFIDVPCFNPLLGMVVDVGTCASGSVLAKGGVDSPFDSFNNVDFVVNRVPEPATALLLGLGLLGLGTLGRRLI